MLFGNAHFDGPVSSTHGFAVGTEAVNTQIIDETGSIVTPSLTRRGISEALLPVRSKLNAPAVFSDTFTNVYNVALGTVPDATWGITNGGTLVTSAAHVRATGPAGEKLSAKATFKLNQTNGQPLFMSFPYSAGFSMEKNLLRLSYYVEKIDGLTSTDPVVHPISLKVRLWNTSNFTGGVWACGQLPYAPGRWHTVEITQSMFNLSTGGTPNPDWSQPIKGIQIICDGTTGATNLPIIHFDHIAVIPHGGTKGGIIITFDDAFVDQAQYGIGYCINQGIPCTLFVTPSVIGTSGYLTWDDVYGLYQTGLVDIAMHYVTPGNLGFPYSNQPPAKGPSPSKEHKHQYMRDFRASTEGQGFDFGPTAANMYVLPNSLDGDVTIGSPTHYDVDIMRQHASMVTAGGSWHSGVDGANGNIFGVGPGSCAYVPKLRGANPWFLPRFNSAGSNTTLMHKWIDSVCAHNDVMSIYMHNISADAGAFLLNWSDVNWRDIVDYIVTKCQAGTLEVLRIPDVSGL